MQCSDEAVAMLTGEWDGHEIVTCLLGNFVYVLLLNVDHSPTSPCNGISSSTSLAWQQLHLLCQHCSSKPTPSCCYLRTCLPVKIHVPPSMFWEPTLTCQAGHRLAAAGLPHQGHPGTSRRSAAAAPPIGAPKAFEQFTGQLTHSPVCS